MYLQREYTDNTSPTESNTTEVEQGVVQAICSALDFGENLGIMFRQSWGNSLAALLLLLAKCATEPRSRYLFKIGILDK